MRSWASKSWCVEEFMNGQTQLISGVMKIIFPNSTIEMKMGEPLSIARILEQVRINPSEVIVSRNGKLVPEDAVANDDDVIRIIRIAHGG
jgi:sulfur carrier protein ThiS